MPKIPGLCDKSEEILAAPAGLLLLLQRALLPAVQWLKIDPLIQRIFFQQSLHRFTGPR